MKVKPILADMSGRLQGIVASHNRGGQYFRGRTVPITPPTGPQTAMRVILTSCVSNWTNVLTGVQRDAWNTYAVANPVLDRFGNSINIGGLGWYNRCNTSRLQAGLPAVNSAPIINGPASLTLPTVSDVAGDFSIAFDDADPWAVADGGALLLYQSRPQSLTRISAAGISLQLVGAILGDTGTPPTSPQVLTPVFPLVTDQRVFLRLVALDSDGRRSADYRPFLDS